MAVYRISDKKASPAARLLPAFLKESGLWEGYLEHVVARAWQEVSPSPEATMSTRFEADVLTVRLKSSLLRNELSFQKEALLRNLNAHLAENEEKNLAHIEVKNIIFR